MKFCKDCRHVKKETLSMSEELIQCKKFTGHNSTHISPVTGKEKISSRDYYFCRYERSLGFCQDGKFFEPEEETFTFFWNGPFSNWHKCAFKVEEITYNCAEQFMMAEKARLFNDRETLIRIMSIDNPKEQKALGRQVKNFNVDKWNIIAKDIVYIGCYAKFSQNEFLKQMLLETEGDLVEASPYDKIWGIGLSSDQPEARNRNTWNGTNWLGEVLTKVREDLKKK